MGRTDDLASVEVFDPITDKWSKYPHEAAEICGKYIMKVFPFDNYLMLYESFLLVATPKREDLGSILWYKARYLAKAQDTFIPGNKDTSAGDLSAISGPGHILEIRQPPSFC